VNVRLSPEQILYTLNHAGADVLLVNAEFMPVLAEIRDKLETVQRFVLISDARRRAARRLCRRVRSPAPPARRPTLPRFRREHPGHHLLHHRHHRPAQGRLLQPPAARAAHPRHPGRAGLPASQGRLHRDDVYMPITPMFHVHAWGLPYVATVMGLRQVPGRYMPEGLLALVEREKVTFSHCVPTILHMLLANPAIRHTRVRGWKVIIGGSALPKGLAQAALDHGIDLFTGYGMSETCPILTLAQIKTPLAGDPARELELRPHRPAHPLVDLRIVDENLLDQPHDGKAPGEIVVRAPWLTQGYFKNPTASEELWSGAICTPTTSAPSTRTATCRSPTASRTSSRPGANGSRPWSWRT
jgi:fatty-acyl-CoA synthase